MKKKSEKRTVANRKPRALILKVKKNPEKKVLANRKPWTLILKSLCDFQYCLFYFIFNYIFYIYKFTYFYFIDCSYDCVLYNLWFFYWVDNIYLFNTMSILHFLIFDLRTVYFSILYCFFVYLNFIAVSIKLLKKDYYVLLNKEKRYIMKIQCRCAW